MEYNNELLTFAIVITKKQYIMDLVNALKSIFTRNTSAASTSGARVPILNSSGEPIGSDTMPNLASVLGAYLGIRYWQPVYSGTGVQDAIACVTVGSNQGCVYKLEFYAIDTNATFVYVSSYFSIWNTIGVEIGTKIGSFTLAVKGLNLYFKSNGAIGYGTVMVRVQCLNSINLTGTITKLSSIPSDATIINQ